ncbi:MAG: hypothetical protein RLZZ301_1062 [Bacteroidota bacterium]|jgi:hypothetical protein
MRYLLVCLLFNGFLSAQNSSVYQTWTELGASYKLSKQSALGLDLTTRFAAGGVNCFFPQISYRYKVSTYFRPSLDYRLIEQQNGFGNFILQHRINANAQFNYGFNAFQFGFRVRYQYSFNRLSQINDSEFNDAFRFKPSLEYDLKKWNLHPSLSTEFFLAALSDQQSYGLNRIRWYAGVEMDISSQQSISVGYFYDQRIYSPGAVNRAILNLGYSYSFEKAKKKSN